MAQIDCPPDCVYLAAARRHPPAIVTRQRERDLHFALQMFQGLNEAAYELLLFFQAVVARYRASTIQPVTDAEVGAAAAALAATLETAARGIIYEHHAALPGAQRIVNELTAALQETRRHDRRVGDGDAALALRRIEAATSIAGEAFGGSETAFLDFLGRLPAELHAAAVEAGQPPAGEPDRDGQAPRIVLP